MEFRPFGGWDYGYDKEYQVAASWTIWALVTWGTLSIDKLEGAAVLAGSLAYTEQVTAKGPRRWGNGASWVHNVQAGYCWYHYFIKGRRDLAVALGSWAEMADTREQVLR